MKRFDTEAGDYPFDYKLAAVQDWRYDDTLNKYRQDVVQMVSWQIAVEKLPAALTSAQNLLTFVSNVASNHRHMCDKSFGTDMEKQTYNMNKRGATRNLLGSNQVFHDCNQHCVSNSAPAKIVKRKEKHKFKLLGQPAAGGEPAQPRGATASQQRRRVFPHRAVCNKQRNQKRGIRSHASIENRNRLRAYRTKWNRRMYREFKQFTINYKFRQKALEMRRRSYLWSQNELTREKTTISRVLNARKRNKGWARKRSIGNTVKSCFFERS